MHSVYQGLQSASSCKIRLLTIFPGEDNTAIELSLSHFDLLPLASIVGGTEATDDQLVSILQTHDASHEFEAISYCWGKEARSISVLLDGQEHLVTPTLEKMCRYLRKSQAPRIVWIDALCLNQDDDEEKRAQIPLMHLIYACAKRVVVWLGESSADSEIGMQYVRDSYATVAEGQKHLISDETSQLDWPISYLITGPLSERDIAQITAFYILLTRPWWYRAWIVQEMGLARDVVLQCGDQTISYAQLRVTLHLTRSVHSAFVPYLEGLKKPPMTGNLEGEPWPQSAVNNALSLEYCRAEIVKHHSPADLSRANLSNYISWYLCYSRGRLCLKAHDRTFSILGIAGPKFRRSMIPDYSGSLPEHNRNVVRAFFAATGNLDIILLSQHSVWLLEASSWAPDWSAPERAAPLHLNNQALERPLKVDLSNVRMPPGSSILTVPGRILTRITKSRLELDTIVEANTVLSTHANSRVDGDPAPRRKRRWWVFKPQWEGQIFFQHALQVLPKDHRLWSEHLNLFLISFCFLFCDRCSELVPLELKSFQGRSLEDHELFQGVDHFWAMLEYLLIGRTICETSDGRLLIAPDFAKAGDLLAIVGGCSNLLVMRNDIDQEGYRVLGDAYLAGMKAADTCDNELEQMQLL